MNFEELENAWAAQTTAPAPAIDAAALKRRIVPEMKRRGRFLRYGIFLTVLSLVALPVLTIANHRHAAPRNPVWHWTYFSLSMIFLIGLLVVFLRALERHAILVERSTRSLRELAAASLRSTEIEIRDYRHSVWVLSALLLFQLADLYSKFPVAEFGWHPFLGRAAFTVGLPLVVGLVFWRHYRVNLAPARAQQAELLRQLSD